MGICSWTYFQLHIKVSLKLKKIQSQYNSKIMVKIAICVDQSDMAEQTMRANYLGSPLFKEKHDIVLVSINATQFCSKGKEYSREEEAKGHMPKIIYDKEDWVKRVEGMMEKLRSDFPTFKQDVEIVYCECKSLSPKNVLQRVVEELEKINPKKVIFGAPGYLRLRQVLNPYEDFKKQASLVKNIDCSLCKK